MRTFWLCFLLFVSGPVVAQQLLPKPRFAVQLGVFKAPDEAKFNPLADLGRLLRDTVPGGRLRLRLGDYPTRAQADSVLAVAKERGFAGLFVIPAPKVAAAPGFLAASGRGARYTVQLGAYQDRSSVPNPKQVQRLGSLYELEQGNTLKLRLGDYDSRAAAAKDLQAVKKLGYRDAYISEADPSTLARENLALAASGREFQTSNTYKRMEGTLNGKWRIVAHVYFSGASLSGYYADPQTRERRQFTYYGYRPNEPQIPITTTKIKANLPGAPSQNPGNGNLQFAAKDPATGQELRFSLRENYPPTSAQVNVVSVYRKKTQPVAQGEIGADVYLEYPAITRLTDAAVAQRLNPQLVQIKGISDPKSLLSQLDQQLASGLKEVNRHYPNYRWLSETFETKILENDRNLLSVRLLQEHVIDEPKNQVTHRSWDLTTGSELKINEQLANGYERQLKLLLRRKLGKKYADLRPSLSDVNRSVADMLGNYYFTSTGLVFFRPYQTDSKIQEPVELTLNYDELRPFIRPGSFISRL
ncbi:MAG: SPOR domain-containing protein [Bernardetiaceae bacterium]|nr:SPOR domain-containing protein [Bernardetiaceae bacterium]